MAVTIVEAAPTVVGGVDTHLDVHVAAALDHTGGLLGVDSFPATPAGYRGLYAWMSGFGLLMKVGVEGTGAYGAGLSRFLRGQDVEVIEVDRSKRHAPPTTGAPGAWPRPATATWRRSVRWWWPSARPATPGSRPSTRSVS